MEEDIISIANHKYDEAYIETVKGYVKGSNGLNSYEEMAQDLGITLDEFCCILDLDLTIEEFAEDSYGKMVYRSIYEKNGVYQKIEFTDGSIINYQDGKKISEKYPDGETLFFK